MENKEYPLEFLTEFIDRDGWIKLREDFIPKDDSDYKKWYNEEKESIEIPVQYFNEGEGNVDYREEKRFFSSEIKEYFLKKLNSDVKDKINQYLYSRRSNEEKKRDLNLIVGDLEHFQNKILNKKGLNKYSQFIELQSFIKNLKTQYSGLGIRVVNPDEIQISQILEEFGNAIKKITQERRKGHKSFKITNEYHVQDLLYIILKSIYPNLLQEVHLPGVGPQSTIVDFQLPEQGILIEVKIIKVKGDEKKIISELKVDIESYPSDKGLKTLICFVYDPQNLIKDNHKFKQLEALRTKNEHTFDVKVVIQR